MSAERWAAIPGYEGRYTVSDAGRVKSLARIEGGRRMPDRILSPATLGLGYRRVALTNDGHRSSHLVHRLVLLAFRGPAPEGHVGCHNDGDPGNNGLGNLRWDTSSANGYDSVRHGTHPAARKTHCDRNHPFDEANTYRTPSGMRACRECRRGAVRRYRARTRAAA